ncbi:MAG: 2-amino-4-hydroxy-6-hydroxymethyldihydropteridine diphosphokinase [Phycisphaerae bacterium]|nr:2-amino-4-hydroxy-6-hydroxymethyldihydropteridine diphosphokinase [Phycisphaerae bacterium]|tara:strand:- start:5707 stop:6252 length:546 start_codon:yes stop_codon:yes gene_type:complete
MSLAWIGLGSNLGDRLANLLQGLECLDDIDGIGVRRVSTFIETQPVGVTGHSPYLNAVAELETEMDPDSLVRTCLDVERLMGRIRSEDLADPQPRLLDLDVLIMGDSVVDRTGVQVPHPRMHDRAFVLLPMVELEPQLLHPVLGRTMEELLESEIDRFGPVEDRCAILIPGSLMPEEDEVI